MTKSGSGHEAIEMWFGLSRASFLVLPRVLIEMMPDEWQDKLATLLADYDEEFPHQPDIGTRVQITRHGKLIPTPHWILNYRHPDEEEIDHLRGADHCGDVPGPTILPRP